MRRASRALLGVWLLALSGCFALIPFHPLRVAWGYTSDDGRIYINESRPMCQVRALGGCREVVLDEGGEFYWLTSLADDPVWLGATQRETCEALREYVRAELRQRSSECTHVQLRLE
ncbi:MAG TPA: hypothetical protein VIF11_14020 [Methylomirabilota bacterium]